MGAERIIAMSRHESRQRAKATKGLVVIDSVAIEK